MRLVGVARFCVLARAAWLLSALACGSSAGIAAEQAPPWKTPLPAGMIAGTPMRFVRVVSAATNCQPNCPEWVSAEGDITTGAAQTFAHFIAELGGRRLPILINSRGGSNDDAIAIGRLIRARRLVVAVARTDLWPCAAKTPNCSPTPPNNIHVMSYDELVTSRLATMWSFDPTSSLGADPDGLAASPIGSSPPSTGTFAVATQWPFLGAIDGHGAALAAQFRYRPGGGAIYFMSTVVDTASGVGFSRSSAGSYVLANGKDEPIQWEESRFVFGATSWVPRDAFCRLRGSRRAFVEFAEPSFDRSDDERRREHLARVDFASAPNAAALFAEACSGPIAAVKR